MDGLVVYWIVGCFVYFLGRKLMERPSVREQHERDLAATAPEVRRSWSRTVGHVWLLIATLSAVAAFALLAGANRPTFGPLVGIVVAFLAAIAVGAGLKMVSAYRRAADQAP
jgi:hypothetical protein